MEEADVPDAKRLRDSPTVPLLDDFPSASARLPSDLWRVIYSFLDPESGPAFRLVCQAFHRLAWQRGLKLSACPPSSFWKDPELCVSTYSMTTSASLLTP